MKPINYLISTRPIKNRDDSKDIYPQIEERHVAQLVDIGHSDNSLTVESESINEIIDERNKLHEAVRAFVDWLDSEDRGPDYGEPGYNRDNHPNGEAIWREWYNSMQNKCSLALELGRKAVAAEVGAR